MIPSLYNDIRATLDESALLIDNGITSYSKHGKICIPHGQ